MHGPLKGCWLKPKTLKYHASAHRFDPECAVWPPGVCATTDGFGIKYYYGPQSSEEKLKIINPGDWVVQFYGGVVILPDDEVTEYFEIFKSGEDFKA